MCDVKRYQWLLRSKEEKRGKEMMLCVCVSDGIVERQWSASNVTRSSGLKVCKGLPVRFPRRGH